MFKVFEKILHALYNHNNAQDRIIHELKVMNYNLKQLVDVLDKSRITIEQENK